MIRVILNCPPGSGWANKLTMPCLSSTSPRESPVRPVPEAESESESKIKSIGIIVYNIIIEAPSGTGGILVLSIHSVSLKPD